MFISVIMLSVFFHFELLSVSQSYIILKSCTVLQVFKFFYPTTYNVQKCLCIPKCSDQLVLLKCKREKRLEDY